MFGSQALETAIGLAALFLVISTAASAIVEAISRVIKKRARDLEKTVDELLSGQPVSDKDLSTAMRQLDDAARRLNDAKAQLSQRPDHADSKQELESAQKTYSLAVAAEPIAVFKNTSIWRSMSSAARNREVLPRRKFRGPTYLSAKAFAEAVMEAVDQGGDALVAHLPMLEKRYNHLKKTTMDNAIAMRAGLEGWFDEAMQRLEGAYKRWVTLVLFIVGVGLAGILNASTVHVAQELWQDPVTRQAVVEASGKLSAEAGGARELTAIADAADQLTALSLPVGWTETPDLSSFTWWLIFPGGWVLTGLMVLLGAPFWFDLLSRLVNVRGAGPKPPAAVNDEASASSIMKSITGELPNQVIEPRAALRRSIDEGGGRETRTS